MKRRFKSILVSTLLFTLISSNVVYAENVNVKINGIVQNIDLTTKVLEGSIYVDVKDLAKILNATLDYTENDGTAILKKRNNTITLYADSVDVIVNGQNLKLTTPPTKIDKTLFAPIRFVSQKLGATVDWIEKSKTIVINTNDTDAIADVKVLDLKEDITSKTKVMSYAIGLESALSVNSSLNNLSESYALLDEQEKSIKELLLNAEMSGDKA